MINPLLSRKEKVKTILNDEVGSFFREGGDNVQFIQLVPKFFINVLSFVGSTTLGTFIEFYWLVH